MSHQLTSTLALEFELDVAGVFQPGYPASGPSYASGGEPGQPDMIEDAQVTGLFIERVKRDRFGLPEFEPPTVFDRPHSMRRAKLERMDLLAELSPGAREEVLRVLSNVLSHEVGEHLLEEAGGYDE